MSSTSINKLLKTTDSAGDAKNVIYLQTICEDHQMSVKLMDSESYKCYQGVVTAENMKEVASELDMPFNDYYEECRLSLTTHIALPGFSYKLDAEDKILKIWKTQPDSIPILFLDVCLKEVRNNFELLDSAIDLLQQKNNALTDRVEKAHKFDQHSRELLEDYRLCVEEKNQMERKILKKVAVLLNSKKQKITELEERLKKYKDLEDAIENVDIDSGNEKEDDERPHSTKKRRALVVESNSDDDFTADTQPMNLPTM